MVGEGRGWWGRLGRNFGEAAEKIDGINVLINIWYIMSYNCVEMCWKCYNYVYTFHILRLCFKHFASSDNVYTFQEVDEFSLLISPDEIKDSTDLWLMWSCDFTSVTDMKSSYKVLHVTDRKSHKGLSTTK